MPTKIKPSYFPPKVGEHYEQWILGSYTEVVVTKVTEDTVYTTDAYGNGWSCGVQEFMRKLRSNQYVQ